MSYNSIKANWNFYMAKIKKQAKTLQITKKQTNKNKKFYNQQQNHTKQSLMSDIKQLNINTKEIDKIL